MAQFPALPLWTDAYLSDTRHLSAEQHGAYLLLLMEAWRRPSCSLPDDDEMLARLACMSGDRWALNRDTIMTFWKLDGRKKEWTQSRLTDERSYVAEKSRSQRDKAASRWKTKTKGDAVAMPEGMPEHMPEACRSDAPTPTPTVREDTNVSSLSEPSVADPGRTKSGKRKGNGYTGPYEAFWKAYPSTEGQSKLNGFKAWQKLSTEHQAQAMASLPSYAALLKRHPDRAVKHVQGYLSGRMFETMGGATVTELETPEQWRKRLGHARNRHEWFPAHWGPAPGAQGCRVPADLLLPGDGRGWAENRAA
ncbi:DUF1376 domain-containing protein [Devosia naphthalenivorans]|uniref:DUF1376 domain-containing protein n=1 Tax=Devosia naphthalenivorans TaxID=2082392 RepID=UPI000D3B62A8|nr:DUF1376 domain-containing protein [Devosia naphthalenivorans]